MINSDIELYCKFYVKTTLTLHELMQLIYKQIGGSIDADTVYTDVLVIDPLQNSDNRGDDFVYWPYHIDVEPIDEDNAEYTSFVNAAKELNNILRANGIQTVVSCDFEDEFN